jgi:Tfp pilus assembly protein PilF/glycosyltransferase involved in cell wall biosynthesis
MEPPVESAGDQIMSWRNGGSIAPPPDVLKHQVVRDYAARFGLQTLIETGTYKGDLIHAVARQFKEIHSIELGRALYDEACQRLAAFDHIHLHHGDSTTVLPEILKTLRSPILFWLDGHYSHCITARGSKDTPIVEELEAIYRDNPTSHVILIDDARDFTGAGDYPSLNELKRLVDRWSPGTYFEVSDDIIRLHNPTLVRNGKGNAPRLANTAGQVKSSPLAVSNQSRKKIVALVPVRNEASRIAFCLRALALYADAIVCLDDASEDESVAVIESLARKCRVEKILRKTKWHLDEPGDRNALLQAGRAVGGTHFIAIDADEAFTANCVANQFLRQLILALQPGDSLAMNWIQLWRGIDQYRFDKSAMTWDSKAVIFCDDGLCSHSSEFVHTPRVPANLSGRCHSLPGYAHGLLHFQFVNWRNLLVKQAWYRCLEHVRQPEKPVQEINNRYAASKDETGLGLKAAPSEWLAGYPFFDCSIVAGPETWREKQVLRWFEEFGRDHFRQLDIWDIEWGQPGHYVAPLPAGFPVQPHCLPEETREAQFLIQKAKAGMATGNLSAAREALESALKFVPGDADLAVVHGNILASLADPAGARWEYVRALALQPDHSEARVKLGPPPSSSATAGPRLPKAAQDCLEQAETYFKNGKLAEARVQLQRMLDITPDVYEVLTALGNISFQLGDMAAAAAAFATAAKQRPQDASSQVLLASAALQAGQIEVFEKALGRALELDPKNLPALQLLAKLNLEQGRLPEAANTYLKIVQHDGENVDATLGLGVCFFKQGYRDMAQKSFERVLKLQPNHDLAHENLRVVQAAESRCASMPPSNISRGKLPPMPAALAGRQ